MIHYLEHKTKKKTEFWEIALNDKILTIRFGRMGTDGEVTVKSFEDEAAARREMDTLIREKEGKGYIAIEEKSNITGEPDRINTFQWVTTHKLFEKYGNRINSEFLKCYTEFSAEESLVYVGNARIDGNLNLVNQNFRYFTQRTGLRMPREEEENYVGAIIIIGDLEVTGNLVNVSSYGPLFYVLGNLKARNMVCGNSIMMIDGHVDIAEITMGLYNNGSTKIGETLTTGWLDESDHCFIMPKPSVKYPDKSLQNLLDEGIIVPEIKNEDDVLNVLFSGGSVFSSSSTSAD